MVIAAYRLIGLVSRVFANGSGDLRSITGRVIPKTLKTVLDASLLNTQQYKVRIKGKVEQYMERSSALRYTSVLQLLKRELLSRPWLRSPTFIIIIIILIIIMMSCSQNGYPWPSVATSPYRSLPLAGLQGYNPYPHIAAVCMFEPLLLQQCPVCLVRLAWIVFVMGGWWPYSWCFVGCCLQILFNIYQSILV